MSGETEKCEFDKHTLRKEVMAKPMNLGDYNIHRNLDIPADEDPEQPGFLVVDQEGGRETWMPRDTFLRDCVVPDEGKVCQKTIRNSEVSGARKNVKDIKIVGNGDAFQLLFKASSEKEGWMKSTKAMACGDGQIVIQVTTQQRNIDGTYSVAEALTVVRNSMIVPGKNNGRKIVVRNSMIVPDKNNGRKTVAIGHKENN